MAAKLCRRRLQFHRTLEMKDIRAFRGRLEKCWEKNVKMLVGFPGVSYVTNRSI